MTLSQEIQAKVKKEIADFKKTLKPNEIANSLEEFNPKKLALYNDDIDGNNFITGIVYDGEDVFSDNGDTVGKSLTYYFFNNKEAENE